MAQGYAGRTRPELERRLLMPLPRPIFRTIRHRHDPSLVQLQERFPARDGVRSWRSLQEAGDGALGDVEAEQ